MNKRFDSILSIVLASLIISCTSADISEDKASRDKPGIKRDNEKEISKPITQLDPWSNSALWKQLVDSKSNASFSVKISKDLPNLTFTINGVFKDKDFYPENVDIFSSTDRKLIQRLNAKNKFDNHGDGFPEIDLHFADLVQFIDLNGDGYLDLRLLFTTGATGNNWYATYIYNPITKKFKYHKDLSMLSGITLDPASKLITTYWRGGWCSECREYFMLDKSERLVLKKLEWTEIDRMNTDSGCLIYAGVPNNKYTAYLGYAFYHMDQSSFDKYIRNKVKIINKEELKGSIDGRTRGPLGTPYGR